MTSRVSVRAGLAVGIAAIFAVGTVTLVRAFNPQPDPPGHYYGPVSINDGQGLQLNVANYRMADPPGEFPPGPCRAALALFDGRGRLLSSKLSNIGPGMSDSLSLNFTRTAPGNIVSGDEGAATGGAGAGRTLVRASVFFRDAKSASCVSSLEVVGADGQSVGFLVPAVQVAFDSKADAAGIWFEKK